MTTMHSDILIESTFIDKLMSKTSYVLDDLQVSAGALVKGFFDFFKKETKIQTIEGINFGAFDSIEKLQKIKEILFNKRKECNHKYKKLHYTYVISRIEDRIHEIIYNNGNEMSGMERFFHAIDSGDIMLISYDSKGKTWNSILNTVANNALKYFSKSIFAHIGIIGKGNKYTGFDWIHSTLHNDGGRTGVKKLPIQEYLSSNNPSELLVMRYHKVTKDNQEKIVDEGIKNVENKTNYDTWDAIGDLTGLNVFRKQEAFNCGELVYNCLKVIDPNLQIEKYALPASYIDSEYMEQVYLTQLS